MIINYYPTKTKFTHQTCNFHKKYPFQDYAGCTCTSTYSSQILNNWDSVMDDILENHLDAWTELSNL